MAKKIIFLFLALLFPVAIFIFLKLFGQNEFQVPVLHEQGTISSPADCPFEYTTPYRVADTVLASLNLNTNDSLFVFCFDPALNTVMDRVSEKFGAAPVRLIAPSGLPDDTDLQRLRKCILLMEPGSSIALLDHRRRIRGYYDGSDRDETDRLMVEIQIILKQY